MTWEVGEQPWVRRQAPQSKFRCYFCGSDTAIISHGDKAADTGRVQVYCDNSRCEARETELIVMRDGAHAGQRNDVAALHLIDTPPRFRGRTSFTAGELVKAYSGDDAVARRLPSPKTKNEARQ